jgi:hypothetical protein
MAEPTLSRARRVRRAFLLVVVLLVLGSVSASMTSASTAASTPARAIDPSPGRVVHAPWTAASPLRGGGPSTGDGPWSRGLAVRELTSRRAQNSRTWLLSNGLHRVEASSTPMNYLGSDGTYHPVRTELTPVEDGRFRHAVEHAPFRALLDEAGGYRFFPDRADASEWVDVDLDVAGSSVSTDTDAIHYDTGHARVDYEVFADRVKGTIILRDRSAPTDWTATVTGTGLRIGPDLWVRDDSGARVAFVVEPFAVDAAGTRRDVQWSYVNGRLEMHLDTAGLEFPVSIDPTVSYSDGGGANDIEISGPADTSNSSTAKACTTVTTGRTVLRTGWNATGPADWDVMIRIPGVTVPKGSGVVSANINVVESSWLVGTDGLASGYGAFFEQVDNSAAFAGTCADVTPRTLWDLSPDTMVFGGPLTAGSVDSYRETAGVQSLVNRAGWVSGNAISIYVDGTDTARGTNWIEHAAFEHGTYAEPTMVVNYDSTPPTTIPASGFFDLSTTFAGDKDWSNSTTALSASWNAATDPETGIRDYDVCFSTVNTGCTAIAGTTMQTGNTSRTATATATGMTNGTTYYVCARAYNGPGGIGAWGCSDGFTIDTSLPTAPTSANIFDLSTTFSADDDWTNSTTALSASWNVGSDTGSGVGTYDVCFSSINTGCTNIPGTTTQTGNTTRTATATATGMGLLTFYYVCVRAVDVAGNTGAWTCSDGFRVEQTAPTNPAQASIFDLSTTFAGDVDWTTNSTALSASWNVGSDANSGVQDYDVCFSTLSTGCTPIAGTAQQNNNVSRTATATATGLAMGTTYYVCVRTRDLAGNVAAWGCSDGFQLDSSSPSNPTQANIFDLSTTFGPDQDFSSSTTALSASWNPGSEVGAGVRDYSWCFSSVSTGCTAIPGTSTSGTANTTRTVTATATGMTNAVTYYVCITTFDVAGNSSGWSCSDGFTIDTGPPTNPTSASVYDLSTTFGPDRDWSNSTTALSASWGAGSDGSGIRDYDVCFSMVNTGCTPIAGTAMQTGNTTRTATATATGMATLTLYYTCVRAWDTGGSSATSWSCSDGFRVEQTAPTNPTQANLFDLSTTFGPDEDWGSSTTALSASWNAGTDANSLVRDYDVCFSTVNTGCTNIPGTTTQTGNTTRTATATATGLATLTFYYVCVRTWDNAGNVTASWQCSDGFRIDTSAPANPTQANIFDLSTTFGPDLDWDTSSTALSASWNVGTDTDSGVRDYDVCFSTVNTGCTAIAGTAMQSANTTRTATATASPAMTQGTTYYVCVRTWNLADAASGWQCSDGFRVDSVAPTNPTQANIFDLSLSFSGDLDWNASATALSASWGAGSDATSTIRDYDVCFSVVNTGCTAIGGAPMQSGNTTRTATATATGMTNGVTYYVCVRTWDVGGLNAGWQCSDGFTIDTTAPTNPTQANIFDLDATWTVDRDWSTNTTALSASWNVGSDAHSGIRDYSACFSTVSTGCTNIAGTSTITGNTSRTATATATGMTNGTTYYVCVQTFNNAGAGAGWQCSDGFTIDTTLPVAPTPVNDGTGADATTQSGSTLAANWGAGSDAGPGVLAGYDWCFSSTLNCGAPLTGGTGSTAFTNISATPTGMVNGTTYYSCVRSRDSAGNVSAYTCSNGFTWLANQAPGAPTLLAQFRSDGTTPIATAAWTTQSTVVLKFNVVDPDNTQTLTPWVEVRTGPFTGTCGTAGAGMFSGTAVAAPTGGTSVPASVTVTGLADNATWYWRACAVDQGGAIGTWTPRAGAPDFRVDTTAPANPSQANLFDLNTTWAADGDFSGSTTALSASWNAGADATSGIASYSVCFSTVNTGCTNIPGTTTQTGNTTRTATATATGMTNGVTYYTCVLALDTAGNSASAWQCSDGFTIDTTAPTNPTAANLFDLDATWTLDQDWSSSTTALSASWNAGADAQSGVRDYDVCFSTVNTGCTNIPGTTTQTGNTTRTATATATGMSLLTLYYTCVRTWNTAGLNGGWQCSDGFRVEQTAPTNPTQANIFDLSVTFSGDLDWNTSATALSASWNTGSDANSLVADYDVCFSTVSTGCTNIPGTTTQTGNTTRTATATASPAMTQGTTYYTCIRTWDNAGNNAGWQCSDGFRIDSIAPTNPTQANIFDLSMTFSGDQDVSSSATALSASWAAATDATSLVRDYDVCFSTVSTGCTAVAGTTMQTANTSRTATATATGMASGSTTYTCVRAWDIAGNSSGWQCSDGFLVDTVAPVNPTQANVFDLSTSFGPDQDWSASTTALSASWNPGSDVGGSGVRDYDVCFSSVSTGCTTIAGTTMQTGNTTRTATATATGMTNATTYYVCVRTWDLAGLDGGWRCSDGFTIDTAPPPAVTPLSITSPTSTDPALTWTTVTDAGSGTAYYRVFRSTSAGTLGTQVNLDGTTTTGAWTDTTLTSQGWYFYTVQAVDAVGNVQTTGNMQTSVAFSPWIYLRNSASVLTSPAASWLLSTTPGASADVVTQPQIRQNTGAVQFQAAVTDNQVAGTLGASPSGRGWFYNAAPGTSYAAGAWRFHVSTDATHLHTGYVNVRAWKVTLSGGAINTSTALTAGWTAGTTNVGGTVSPQSHVVDVTMPAVTFAAGEYLYVEYWENVTVAASGGGSSNARVAFQVNTASEYIEPTPPPSINTISLSVDSASIGTTPSPAVPGIDTTAQSTLTVTTDATTGYTLQATDSSDTIGMDQPAVDTLADWTGTDAAPTIWTAGTGGYFGIGVLSATGGKDTARWGTGTTATDFANLRFAGLRTTSTTLHQRTTYSATPDTIVTDYRATFSSAETPGTYSTSVVYTATINP